MLGTGCPELQASSRAAEAVPINPPSLDADIEAAIAQSRVPGLQLGVLAGDQIVYSRGFGHADLEAKRSVAEEYILKAVKRRG